MGLTGIRELPLCEIINMPVKTATAKESKITFGTSSTGKRFALVLNKHLEGLHNSESFFLVSLIKEANINFIKFVVEGATTGKNPNLTPGKLAVVSDYLDNTYFPPVHLSRNFYPYRNLNLKLNEELATELATAIGDDHKYEDPVTIAVQDGPSLPSQKNIEMYRSMGNELYTISNFSPVDHAASLGLIHQVFARVRDSNFEYVAGSNDGAFANLLTETWSDAALSERVNLTAINEKTDSIKATFAEKIIPADLSQHDTIDVECLVGNTAPEVEAFKTTMAQINDFITLDRPYKFGMLINNTIFNEFV